MAFFRYLAQEVRELLAQLGLRSLDAAVGRTDLLTTRPDVFGADLLDLTPVLAAGAWLRGKGLEDAPATLEIRHGGKRNTLPLADSLNERILHDARSALAARGPVTLSYRIRNGDRSAGTRLAGTIGQMYGDKGLPPGTITINVRGSAGQSFGAFNAPGMALRLVGDANDYVGKGMAGGSITIAPDKDARFAWHENVIAGNTLLYGATGGELFAAGQVGERFAVRNSGAVAVVEGIGDHGCEYMTGGTVLILGPTGRNFGAGMTGGRAYILDEHNSFNGRYNPQLIEVSTLSERDEAQVQALLRRHLEQTHSPRAAEILAHWATYRSMFLTIAPSETVAQAEKKAEGSESHEKVPPTRARPDMNSGAERITTVSRATPLACVAPSRRILCAEFPLLAPQLQ